MNSSQKNSTVMARRGMGFPLSLLGYPCRFCHLIRNTLLPEPAWSRSKAVPPGKP